RQAVAEQEREGPVHLAPVPGQGEEEEVGEVEQHDEEHDPRERREEQTRELAPVDRAEPPHAAPSTDDARGSAVLGAGSSRRAVPANRRRSVGGCQESSRKLQPRARASSPSGTRRSPCPRTSKHATGSPAPASAVPASFTAETPGSAAISARADARAEVAAS